MTFSAIRNESKLNDTNLKHFRSNQCFKLEFATLSKIQKLSLFSNFRIFILFFRNETTMVDIVAVTVGTRCGTNNTLQSYRWHKRRFVYWKYRHG